MFQLEKMRGPGDQYALYYTSTCCGRVSGPYWAGMIDMTVLEEAMRDDEREAVKRATGLTGVTIKVELDDERVESMVQVNKPPDTYDLRAEPEAAPNA